MGRGLNDIYLVVYWWHHLRVIHSADTKPLPINQGLAKSPCVLITQRTAVLLLIKTQWRHRIKIWEFVLLKTVVLDRKWTKRGIVNLLGADRWLDDRKLKNKVWTYKSASISLTFERSVVSQHLIEKPISSTSSRVWKKKKHQPLSSFVLLWEKLTDTPTGSHLHVDLS